MGQSKCWVLITITLRWQQCNRPLLKANTQDSKHARLVAIFKPTCSFSIQRRHLHRHRPPAPSIPTSTPSLCSAAPSRLEVWPTCQLDARGCKMAGGLEGRVQNNDGERDGSEDDVPDDEERYCSEADCVRVYFE
jgi:hypothetical protein